MNHRRLFVALAFPALLLTSPAYSQGNSAVDQGRVHFNRAVELFTEGNYDAALIEFRRANEVAPNFKLLFNIGQTCHETKDYVCALDSYNEYLQLGGDKIPAARVAEVKDSIKKLKARVATIIIEVNVANAEVLLDDELIGKSPLAKPVTVSTGRRKFSASKPGLLPVVQVLDVAGGDTKTLALKFDLERPAAAIPGASSTGAPPPSSKRESSGIPAGVWIGFGATAALTAGAVITGLLAGRAHNDYEKELDSIPASQSNIDNASDRTRRYSILADALGGAAVITGGISLYFALTSGDSSESDSASMGVSVGAGSTSLRGRF